MIAFLSLMVYRPKPFKEKQLMGLKDPLFMIAITSSTARLPPKTFQRETTNGFKRPLLKIAITSYVSVCTSQHVCTVQTVGVSINCYLPT